MKFKAYLLGVVFFLNTANSKAALCRRWSEARDIGALDIQKIPEASGIAVSSVFSNRLYHKSDGNNPLIFVTDFRGNIVQELSLPPLEANSDTEELGYGPCGAHRCIFVGDIGDNDLDRAALGLHWFRERDVYSSDNTPASHLTLKYPDQPHNAEALVVHPKSGDVFVFTKEKSKTPSQIYRLSAEALNSQRTSVTLQPFGHIDVAALLPGSKKKELRITGASVSQDGTRLLLLTYGPVLEIAWNFSAPLKATSEMKEGADYGVILFNALDKQEALGFLPDDSGFIVSTEGKRNGISPLVQIDCLK